MDFKVSATIAATRAFNSSVFGSGAFVRGGASDCRLSWCRAISTRAFSSSVTRASSIVFHFQSKRTAAMDRPTFSGVIFRATVPKSLISAIAGSRTHCFRLFHRWYDFFSSTPSISRTSSRPNVQKGLPSRFLSASAAYSRRAPPFNLYAACASILAKVSGARMAWIAAGGTRIRVTVPPCSICHSAMTTAPQGSPRYSPLIFRPVSLLRHSRSHTLSLRFSTVPRSRTEGISSHTASLALAGTRRVSSSSAITPKSRDHGRGQRLVAKGNEQGG